MKQGVESGGIMGGRAEASPLFPRGVRRAVLGGAVVFALFGLYLFSVRGTAILFDLANAVGSLCF